MARNMEIDTKSFVEKVVASGVLLGPPFVRLPERGASDEELAGAESRLGIKLHDSLKDFLRIYNGANLDIIRINSTSDLEIRDKGLTFASDPAGFVFHMDPSGRVFCEDTDGGDFEKVASCFDDFFFNYIFGSRSAEHLGTEWVEQLKAADIISTP